MVNENRMLKLFDGLIPTFSAPIHVIELGANDGFHTRVMTEILNKHRLPWKYLAVEPDPRLQAEMPEGVTYVGAGIAQHTGKGTLFLSDGEHEGNRYTGSSSLRTPTRLLHEHWPHMTFDTCIETPTITLDDLCTNNEFGHVDFIWCDVQGCEVDVVRSGKTALKNTKWMFMEYANGELYEGQIPLIEIERELDGIMRLHTDFRGDALFVNVNLDIPSLPDY